MNSNHPYVPPALASPTPSVVPLRPMPTQPLQSSLRAAKSRLIPSINPKDLSTVPFSFESPIITDVTLPVSSEASALATPAKRRREVDAPVTPQDTPSGGASTSRRRTRSWRDQNLAQASGQGEAMDVEEEGPQRKQVARR